MSGEWVEWEGEMFPLPARSTKRAVRLAQLVVALVAPHVQNFTDPTGHTDWTWDGDGALLERVLQGALNEETNNALTTVERTVVKEFR